MPPPRPPRNTQIAADPADPLKAAFERAAQQLAEKRAEEAMCVEDRIAKWVRRWTQEWEEDLERRPDEIKNSGSGKDWLCREQL